MRFTASAICIVILSSLVLAGDQSASQPAVMTVTIRALIDGRSRIWLKGNTACWEQFENAAPGKHEGRDEPTTINGVDWRPNWEDADLDPEVRVKHSKSDSFDHVTPALPVAAMTVTIEKIHCREEASIVQSPSKENDFTTIVEFNDNQTDGSDWYEVKLTFTPG